MYQSLNSKQRDVLIQCLLLANHEGKEWEWQGKLFKAKPGQFITSLDALKQVCARDVSVKNIRTALQKLKRWQFLANESAKTGRLISINNWGKYQQQETKSAKLTANRRQTGGKQAATNKKEKNEKNEKNTIIVASKLAKTPDPIKGILNLFRETLNPGIAFNNKTERGAINWLLKEYGETKLKKTINYAASVQGEKYAPVITTPYQLKIKLGALMVFYKRETSSGIPII